MRDEIISYRDMCDIEKVQTLQRGMNYRLNTDYSVILMSQRRNAPYKDKVYDDGFTIEYEGHDILRSNETNPKLVDQPKFTKKGNLTENGKFVKAIDDFKKGIRSVEIVRVYEKIFPGIWSEKGFFRLVDYKFITSDNDRKVFRFILEETEVDFESDTIRSNKFKPRSRLIPSEIKKEVWKRDSGKCVICGATDELHFDHDLPFSKGVRALQLKMLKFFVLDII